MRRERAIDFDRVADLYDVYVRFGDDIPFFLELCARATGPVLELMCGTGRLSLPLIEAGVALTCVDYSEAMLDVLRRKLADRGLSAALHAQDVRQLDLPERFGLALLPFHSFAELVEEEDQRLALAAIYRALAPAGRFVCALHNPVVRVRSLSPNLTEVGRFPLPDREATLVFRVRTELLDDGKRAAGLQVYEIVDDAGHVLERRELPIRFALPRPEEFERLARTAGFQVEQLYGDYAKAAFEPLTSPYMIWTLRRPEDGR